MAGNGLQYHLSDSFRTVRWVEVMLWIYPQSIRPKAPLLARAFKISRYRGGEFSLPPAINIIGIGLSGDHSRQLNKLWPALTPCLPAGTALIP